MKEHQHENCDVITTIIAKLQNSLNMHRPGGPTYNRITKRIQVLKAALNALDREYRAEEERNAATPDDGETVAFDADFLFGLIQHARTFVRQRGIKGNDYHLNHEARSLALRFEAGDFNKAMKMCVAIQNNATRERELSESEQEAIATLDAATQHCRDANPHGMPAPPSCPVNFDLRQAVALLRLVKAPPKVVVLAADTITTPPGEVIAYMVRNNQLGEAQDISMPTDVKVIMVQNPEGRKTFKLSVGDKEYSMGQVKDALHQNEGFIVNASIDITEKEVRGLFAPGSAKCPAASLPGEDVYMRTRVDRFTLRLRQAIQMDHAAGEGGYRIVGFIKDMFGENARQAIRRFVMEETDAALARASRFDDGRCNLDKSDPATTEERIARAGFPPYTPANGVDNTVHFLHLEELLSHFGKRAKGAAEPRDRERAAGTVAALQAAYVALQRDAHPLHNVTINNVFDDTGQLDVYKEAAKRIYPPHPNRNSAHRQNIGEVITTITRDYGPNGNPHLIDTLMKACDLFGQADPIEALPLPALKPRHRAAGMTATVLATQLAEAFCKDGWRDPPVERVQFGEHVSKVLRELANDFCNLAAGRPINDDDNDSIYVGKKIKNAFAGSVWANTRFTREDALLAVCTWIERGVPDKLEIPHDILTHQGAWRSALVGCCEFAEFLTRHTGSDEEDAIANVSYWQHELNAFDRAYKQLRATPMTHELDNVRDYAGKVRTRWTKVPEKYHSGGQPGLREGEVAAVLSPRAEIIETPPLERVPNSELNLVSERVVNAAQSTIDAMARDYKLKYGDYEIAVKRDFGSGAYLIDGLPCAWGYVVTQKGANAMPGAVWFQTVKAAKEACDVLDACTTTNGSVTNTNATEFYRLLKLRNKTWECFKMALRNRDEDEMELTMLLKGIELDDVDEIERRITGRLPK